MLLCFKGGDHYSFVKIDGKRILVSSEVTKKKFFPMEEVIKRKVLARQANRQDYVKYINKLKELDSEEEVKNYVVSEYKKLGYSLYKEVDIND